MCSTGAPRPQREQGRDPAVSLESDRNPTQITQQREDNMRTHKTRISARLDKLEALLSARAAKRRLNDARPGRAQGCDGLCTENAVPSRRPPDFPEGLRLTGIIGGKGSEC